MSSLDELFDNLENQRREAYVRAILRAAESNDVAGWIGFCVPLVFFHALGLMAIPVHGVDGEILQFSEEEGLCSVVDATLTYAKTDKCPLIHSSRLIVVDDSCPVMAERISALPDKDVHIYRTAAPKKDKHLTAKLEEVYGRRLDEGALSSAEAKMNECSALLAKLKSYSDLSGLQVYILEYYLNFLALGERVKILHEVCEGVSFSREPSDFVPICVQSGAGIYRQIDQLMEGRNYRIVEAGCGQRTNYDFVYEACPFADGTRISYRGK